MPPRRDIPSSAAGATEGNNPSTPPSSILAALAGVAQRLAQNHEAAEVILSALESLDAVLPYEYALLELMPGFVQGGAPTVFRATPQAIEAVTPSNILVDDRSLLLPLEFSGRELGRLRLVPVADVPSADEMAALRALAGYMSLALCQAELETAAKRAAAPAPPPRRRQSDQPQPRVRRPRSGNLKAELSQMLSAQLGLTVLCERVLERLVSALELDAGAIFTIEERSHELVRAAQRGVPGPLPARLAVSFASPVALGRSAAAGTPQLIRDISTAPLESDTDRLLRTWGFHTLLCFPLFMGKRLAGGLQLMSRRSNAVSSESIALLTAMSDELALALQNAAVFERLSTMAVTDSLTGLHNRRFCEEFVRKHMQAAQRSHRSCSLLLVDIDQFGSRSEALGPEAGDTAIRDIAAVLLSSIRAADLAGRYDGPRLMAVLPNADLATAMSVAERVRANVRAMLNGIQAADETLTVSVGVSCYPACAADLPALFSSAAAALQVAGDGGQNRVVAAPILPSAT